jgi:hypothetical protein
MTRPSFGAFFSCAVTVGHECAPNSERIDTRCRPLIRFSYSSSLLHLSLSLSVSVRVSFCCSKCIVVVVMKRGEKKSSSSSATQQADSANVLSDELGDKVKVVVRCRYVPCREPATTCTFYQLSNHHLLVGFHRPLNEQETRDGSREAVHCEPARKEISLSLDEVCRW